MGTFPCSAERELLFNHAVTSFQVQNEEHPSGWSRGSKDWEHNHTVRSYPYASRMRWASLVWRLGSQNSIWSRSSHYVKRSYHKGQPCNLLLTLTSLFAKTYQTPFLFQIYEDEPVLQAFKLMRRKRIGGLPVVERQTEKPVGNISLRDVHFLLTAPEIYHDYRLILRNIKTHVARNGQNFNALSWSFS